MNLSESLEGIKGALFRLALAARILSPKKTSTAFGTKHISQIMIINLDRQTKRWHRSMGELGLNRANNGRTLDELVQRVSAVDARNAKEIASSGDVDPVYHLSDQLAVAPDSRLSKAFSADIQIRMTPQEIAVARSHIETWKAISAGSHQNVLVLEDDFYFRRGALAAIDKAWSNMQLKDPDFDLLYVSYKEVDGGADMTKVSSGLLRPWRGLWYLSGYVLSKKGAETLLRLMPVVGPVDLWANLKFSELKVYATSISAVEQRRDGSSDNSYSILPLLARAGIVSSERPNLIATPRRSAPILIIDETSSIHATAMAISILGISCKLGVPANGFKRRQGPSQWTFGAYIYPKLSDTAILDFLEAHPSAKIILSVAEKNTSRIWRTLKNSHSVEPEQILELPAKQSIGWTTLCEFLGLGHPNVPYPKGAENWQNVFHDARRAEDIFKLPSELGTFDDSPWISSTPSTSVNLRDLDFPVERSAISRSEVVSLSKKFETNWRHLSETFPGNIALFDPTNIEVTGRRSKLIFRKAKSDVRDYSSAAIAATNTVLYGRLEAKIRPSHVPGIITGLFFHRSLPRQEIDLEFLGSDPTKIITNVYFNPGDNGTDLSYGYRGTPITIDLGFDASEQFHRYAIEWTSKGVRWFVDGKVVHERRSWEPTPIPHLPMQAFLNVWSSHSPELGGVVQDNDLPASSEVEDLLIVV